MRYIYLHVFIIHLLCIVIRLQDFNQLLLVRTSVCASVCDCNHTMARELNTYLHARVFGRFTLLLYLLAILISVFSDLHIVRHIFMRIVFIVSFPFAL